jgi:hypothetical protein
MKEKPMTEKFLLAAAITCVLYLFLGISSPTIRKVTIEPKLQTIPTSIGWLPSLLTHQN